MLTLGDATRFLYTQTIHMQSPVIHLLLYNIRSAHNVGALLRTAEGCGVRSVTFVGYTAHLRRDNDPRLPHIIDKAERAIAKTALGAETMLTTSYAKTLDEAASRFQCRDVPVVALEQSPEAITLHDFQPPKELALVLGNEVTGIEPSDLALVDNCLEIPMLGHKESHNVAAAGAMALHWLRFR